MGAVNTEKIVMEIQGELVIQNKRINDLQEEVRLLRVQISRQKVTVTPTVTKIGYRTINPERAAEVFKQSKLNKNQKL